MNVQELKKFASSFSQSNSTELIKRRAAYEILNSVSKIEKYISDNDRVNQATDICKTVWQNSYNLTKKKIFQIYLSVAKDIYNKMYTYNELETSIPKDYNVTCLEDFINYLKKQTFSDNISYPIAVKVYEMMELKNEN